MPTLIVLAFFFLYACTNPQMGESPVVAPNLTEGNLANANSQALSSAGYFHKAVGAPISVDKGNIWISNFRKTYATRQAAEYSLQACEIKTILNNPTCVGISLYYALDGKGQEHILPIGTTQAGKALKAADIVIQNGSIDWATAWQWIAAHPGSVDAHFFGANTFQRLLSDGTCKTIRTTFAINDAGSPQLLLTNANARTMNGFEDASFPCPPCHPI